MKSLILIMTLTFTSVAAFAKNCDNLHVSDEIGFCLSSNIKSQKIKLKTAYDKLYKATSAKPELEAAQIAWLDYRNKQCGDFITKDADYSPGSVILELDCLSELNQQRIDYLKTKNN